MVGWVVGWLAGWPAGWPAGWLVGWLAGWLVGFGKNPQMIVSQNCIDFCSKTYRFGHISSQSEWGTHADRSGVPKAQPFVNKCTPNPRKGQKIATVRREMRQKCTPFAQKCTPNPCGGIRNANRSSKNALKMQTVRSKIVPREAWLRARRNICGAQIATVRTIMRQKCVPFGRNSMSNMQKWQPFVRKCAENAYPRAEIRDIDVRRLGWLRDKSQNYPQPDLY